MESSGEARLRKSIELFVKHYGIHVVKTIWKTSYVDDEKYKYHLAEWNKDLLEKLVGMRTLKVGIKDRAQVQEMIGICEKELEEFTLSGGLEQLASTLVDDFHRTLNERYMLGDAKEFIRELYRKCAAGDVPRYGIAIPGSKHIITLTIVNALIKHNVVVKLVPETPQDDVTVGELYDFISEVRRKRPRTSV